MVFTSNSTKRRSDRLSLPFGKKNAWTTTCNQIPRNFPNKHRRRLCRHWRCWRHRGLTRASDGSVALPQTIQIDTCQINWAPHDTSNGELNIPWWQSLRFSYNIFIGSLIFYPCQCQIGWKIIHMCLHSSESNLPQDWPTWCFSLQDAKYSLRLFRDMQKHGSGYFAKGQLVSHRCRFVGGSMASWGRCVRACVCMCACGAGDTCHTQCHWGRGPRAQGRPGIAHVPPHFPRDDLHWKRG